MSARLMQDSSAASRGLAQNSPTIEQLRRRLQASIPYGTEKQIATRLGRPADWVYGQVEGRHPLTGDVIIGCLLAMPEEHRDVALEELLDGMVRLDRRKDLTEALRQIEALASKAAALMQPGGN